ncbi:MAG: hypothetical protein ACLSDQ_09300 [Adlercreutzia equolifaciens]
MSGVKQTDVVPSITDLPGGLRLRSGSTTCSTWHQRHRHRLRRHVLPAGGEGPMTVVSPEQLAAREKAKKIAAAKAAKEAKAAAPSEAPTTAPPRRRSRPR